MSNISIERLEELSDILKSWLDGYDPLDDKEQFETISGAMGAISELKGLKKASTHPVGEVVAWGENIPPRQGINRKVDFRWLDVNVEPGTLLYAAPQLQPVSNPYTLPDVWIKCSERMPDEFGRYWCYVEEQNSLGKSHYQWNCSWNGDCWSDASLSGCVTHWMPLAAAPRPEVS